MTNQELIKAVAEAMGLKVMFWNAFFWAPDGNPSVCFEVADPATWHGWFGPVYLSCDDITGHREYREKYKAMGFAPDGPERDGHFEWCYQPVPNWPEDLPACMRDLWPWFIANGYYPTLCWGMRGNAICNVAQKHHDAYTSHFCGAVVEEAECEDILQRCALAICHAVLAVKEKLKERSDV